MLSLSAQIKKQETLSDIEGLKAKLNGRISDKMLDKLLKLGINPFNPDGSLKSKNTLSVMIWRYKNKDKWYKTKSTQMENDSTDKNDNVIIQGIRKSFENLKNKRFFVSEADFQHTLAMELEKTFAGDKDVKILLEFPVLRDGHTVYIDIMVTDRTNMYPIELKYKTRLIPSDDIYENTNIEIKHILKNHGAQDLGGYDFWKDVHRIETLIDNDIARTGVCIFVTNDMYYLNEKYDVNAQSFAFRLGTGIHVHGAHHWNVESKETVPDYIKKNRGFYIQNDYIFDWDDFYECDAKNGCFKSLFIEIPSK